MKLTLFLVHFVENLIQFTQNYYIRYFSTIFQMIIVINEIAYLIKVWSLEYYDNNLSDSVLCIIS